MMGVNYSDLVADLSVRGLINYTIYTSNGKRTVFLEAVCLDATPSERIPKGMSAKIIFSSGVPSEKSMKDTVSVSEDVLVNATVSDMVIDKLEWVIAQKYLADMLVSVSGENIPVEGNPEVLCFKIERLDIRIDGPHGKI